MEKDTNPEVLKRHRMEVNGTIILSIAALAITWCTYQSTLWNGIQSFRLAKASTHSREALQQTIVNGQHQAVDVGVMVNFVNAVVDKDQTKIKFYIDRSRPELGAIMSEWLASDPLNNNKAPAHPFVLSSYKKMVGASIDSVANARNEAERLWKDAENANRCSDNYVLLTVILSIVMFLGAIAPKLEYLKLARILNLISIIISVLVLTILFFYMPTAPRT